MLAIARTVMGNPALLLLDEPSEGLTPIIQQRIGKLLRQLRPPYPAEQNMHFRLGLGSHAIVISPCCRAAVANAILSGGRAKVCTTATILWYQAGVQKNYAKIGRTVCHCVVRKSLAR